MCYWESYNIVEEKRPVWDFELSGGIKGEAVNCPYYLLCVEEVCPSRVLSSDINKFLVQALYPVLQDSAAHFTS